MAARKNCIEEYYIFQNERRFCERCKLIAELRLYRRQNMLERWRSYLYAKYLMAYKRAALEEGQLDPNRFTLRQRVRAFHYSTDIFIIDQSS